MATSSLFIFPTFPPHTGHFSGGTISFSSPVRFSITGPITWGIIPPAFSTRT